MPVLYIGSAVPKGLAVVLAHDVLLLTFAHPRKVVATAALSVQKSSEYFQATCEWEMCNAVEQFWYNS
jgi:hypothetical protein